MLLWNLPQIWGYESVENVKGDKVDSRFSRFRRFGRFSRYPIDIEQMLKKVYKYILLLLIVSSSLALDPADLGKPWSEIAQLMDARDYKGAISSLNSYAKSSSNVGQLAEIYYRIGNIHHEYTHDYDQALKAYQKVINLDEKADSPMELEPFRALSQTSIAGIHRRVGRYEDAVEVYKKVTADYSGTEYAVVATRNIEGIQNALTKIEVQRRIIEKYPDTEFAAEAQFEIAELYLSVRNLNNPQLAIREYTKLVEKYANSRRSAEAQLKIGNAYRMFLNMPEEAISSYQKLLQSQFSAGNLAAEALFQMGRLYYNDLHDYAKSLDAFSRLLRDYPAYWKFPSAIYWQGMCYEQLEKYGDSVKAFETFVALYPEENPGWLADIDRYGERKVKLKLEAKIEELRKLIPEAHWSEAEKLRSLGKYREALSVYRDLIGRNPDSEYSERARTRAEEVKYLAEIQICRENVAKKSVEAPASQYRIAEIYETEMQDYASALAEYEKVVADYSGNYWAADALYRMGLIYSGSELLEAGSTRGSQAQQKRVKTDYNKAIKSFRQLIKEYKNTYTAAKAYYQMGEIYSKHLNNYKQALEAYEKVASDYPERSLYVGEGYSDSLADESLFKIGRIYYKNLENHDKALEIFTKFLNDYPNSCRRAAAYSFIAVIQEKQRNRKATVDSLEQIIEIIFASDVQSSFFARDAIYADKGQEDSLQNIHIQRDIIKQLRQKINQLQR